MFANYRGKLEMKVAEKQLHAAYDALEQIIGQTTVADGITTVEKEIGWRSVIDELT